MNTAGHRPDVVNLRCVRALLAFVPALALVASCSGHPDSTGANGNRSDAGSAPATINCGVEGTGPAHWISPTGAASWDQCVGSTALADSAACSLDTANSSAAAGDVVILRGGTYTTGISLKQSGTPTAGIAFKNYGGETVRVMGVTLAIDLANRSYITLDGISADTVDYWLRLNACDHICVFHSTFTGLRTNSQPNWPDGLVISNSSHHNWVKNCSAGGIGYALPSGSPSAIGGMFLGDWEIANDQSSYNLIENNTFYHGGHHVLEINSGYNIIRNNYFHNENWTGTCAHPETNNRCADRNIIIEDNTGIDAVRNVIEGNVIAYEGVPADGNTSAGMSVRTQSNIMRNNLFFYNDGPGLVLYTGSGQPYDASHGHIYNNVFFHNGFTAIVMTGSDGRYNSGLLFDNTGGTSGRQSTNVSIRNNLFWDNNGTSVSFYYTNAASEDIVGNYYQTVANRDATGNSAVTLASGNLQSTADPLFANTSGTPDVSNPNQFDFHVQPGSPAVNAGVFLTKTTTAGSGTVIPLEDAGFFIDGFGIVPGDRIQLQGQSQTAGITSVDYSTNQLTIDTTLTWTAGLGVSLPYSGQAPDIGAFEQ